MFDLDSPKWKQLDHAYGSAEDIPALLRALPDAPIRAADYQTEPWFSLWSALCHQGDVYPASYAAVPHIVAIAASKVPLDRLEFINFVSRVEIERHNSRAPQVGAELEADYFAALEQTRRLAWECLGHKLENESHIQVLLSAMAAFNGQAVLANVISEFPEPNYCPACDAEVMPLGYDLG